MADESSRREEFKECSLSYLRSPVEVLTDKTRRHVTGLRMELNKLEVRFWGHIIETRWWVSVIIIGA